MKAGGRLCLQRGKKEIFHETRHPARVDLGEKRSSENDLRQWSPRIFARSQGVSSPKSTLGT